MEISCISCPLSRTGRPGLCSRKSISTWTCPFGQPVLTVTSPASARISRWCFEGLRI
ncbi:hypothetical protein ACFPRL_36245 [Pseudoclavibacter helvolus]